jgi:hypothetical protein
MKDWRIRLIGHGFDLEDLSTQEGSSDWIIFKEEGDYFLKSSLFDDLKDAEEVRKVATDILDKLNGLAKLRFTNFQPLKIDAVSYIDDSGKKHQFVLIHSATLTMRSRLSATATVVKSDDTIDASDKRQPSIVELGYSIAKKDANVAEALRIFGSLETNWFNLYKVFEIIRDDVGGHDQLIRTGWTSKKKIRRFTGTAQSSEILGDEARHVRYKGGPPSDPMSLSEAKSFVKAMLEQWIRSKI